LNAYNGERTFSNAVSGAGVVALVNVSDVTVLGDNSNFSGEWNIGAGSVLRVTAASQLGDRPAELPSVANDGRLVITNAAGFALDHAVSGAGDLEKNGPGALFAGPRLTYGGATFVENATKTLRTCSTRYGGYLPELDFDLFDHFSGADYGDAAVRNGDTEFTFQLALE
ncbi:MAG: hypothetical protein LBE50_03410, partial [Gallionellaceae bacterium]|jgi:hypothetical protein|nr:hypothetical protein [Gallionellaceae bacterium]